MKPRAVDTNIIGQCWNTHHLTCHAVTISYLSWCKKRGDKMCTDAAVSLDACTTGPQTGGVFGCMVCLHVYVGVKGKVEAIFHLAL